MNVESVNVSGVSGVADGVLSATITDAWFDAERTAHIVEVARRIERQQNKASRRLADACTELDAALQGHPLEKRLRESLLSPLERDCVELATVAARVNLRLTLFAPAQSQAHFEQGLALQLADIQVEQDGDAAQAIATNAPPMPFGYWISEEGFNRLERARSAAMLLASVEERMAVPFDAFAASAAYVHDDLAAVVGSARHSSDMEADDDPA